MSTITSTIEAITANTRKFVEQQTKASSSARNLTWTIMAEVYALGLEAFKPENAVDFDRELFAHGLDPAKQGENPWLKVINVAVGDFEINSKGKRYWKANQSFSKYARALRYMQSKGVKAEFAKEFIRAKTEHVTGGSEASRCHLIGMIAADKLVHRPVRRDMTDRKAMAAALASPALAEVAIPALEEDAPRFARVFGEVRDGMFVIRGLIEGSEGAAKHDINKLGKALLKEAS